MQYKNLIDFQPIASVVQLVGSDKKSVAQSLVRTFVFSQKMAEDVTAVVLKNLALQPDNYQSKGIQIVGSYGTGKSHLMALIAAVAEDASLLPELSHSGMQAAFAPIAGQYKVLRFEVGIERPLKEVVFAHIERYLERQGLNYIFPTDTHLSWKQQIQDMMAAFEAQFPDKHFLIVIDELLEYLKGRNPTELNNDLMLLRQLGEACDNSRFKLMFGVQELLYRSPEFQFAAETLNKIADRYSDLVITREDVAYVVKERLLRKNEHQKKLVREHLLRFAHLFEGINNNPGEYVDLFPVHPAYISNFERIKHGKSQREILKVLSDRFQRIMEEEVPEHGPGLITYDSYWPDLAGDPAMLSIPDIRSVKDKADIIADKIAGHFTGARSNRLTLAQSIANALAIRILCDDLDKKNGATAHSLKEDLAITINGVDNPEMLQGAVGTTASQIVSATAGQYVEQDAQSGQYYIRTEGGINIDQLVRDYAQELKRDSDRANEYYFEFLRYQLGQLQETYRTGFPIWKHTLEWNDKKSFRRGYIFLGNPKERSTTEPVQEYYLFYSPLFTGNHFNDKADEVYFDMSGLSEAFRDTICLYGSARAKEMAATSNQKKLFTEKAEEHRKQALALFNQEYVDATTVRYNGKTHRLKDFSLPGEGAAKESIFSSVASRLLNPYFNDKYPEYPAFTDLRQPLHPDNFQNHIRNALKKVANPATPNREGEALLAGLGITNGSGLNLNNSRYADVLRRKLQEKGEGKVVNRDEIIYCHYAPQNLWYAKDFNGVDHEFIFVVLAALAYKGDIDIQWGGKSISATNIEALTSLTDEDLYTFQHIRAPQGLPVKALKALFEGLKLPDLTSDLEKPETIARIVSAARTLADNAVRAKATLKDGIRCRQVALQTEEQVAGMKAGLEALSQALDSIQAYNTYGKLKNFRHTEADLQAAFATAPYIATLDKLSERARKFDQLISYLSTARSYVPETEQPLYQDLSSAIEALPDIVGNPNASEADLKKYEARLNDLVDRYADYYIAQYTRHRLSNADANAKERILQSDNKRICDIIKDTTFLSSQDYNKWVSDITGLRAADVNVTKARVKEEPYHDFNPKEVAGKTVPHLRDLEIQLQDILDGWAKNMMGVFKDPSVQENIELLPAADQALAAGFRDGSTHLNQHNAASLRDIINQLARGMEKVELPTEDIRRRFSKPLTPTEAKAAFEAYIDELCEGKDRNRVRIIMK